MNLVSIVVTVFNAESTLKRCLDSIVNQTYRNLDIVIVDDGSTDGSSKICDQYKENDQRITVIHKKNGGVSRARNSGLEAVKGNLLTFCDSDDWYELDWIENLVEKYVQTDADRVSGNFKLIKTNECVDVKRFKDDPAISLNDEKDKYHYICKTVFSNRDHFAVWGHIYSAEIISKNSIKFCTSCENFAEDLGFNLIYLQYCKKLAFITECGYCYFVREESMMDRTKNKLMLNAMNEVAYYVYGHLAEVKGYLHQHYPVIHFLIMNNQYQKVTGDGAYAESINQAIDTIQNMEWYLNNSRALKKNYILLKKEFGLRSALQAIMLSGFCYKRNTKGFEKLRSRYSKYIGLNNNNIYGIKL